MRNPFKFRLFLLTRLPSAFFSGLRVKMIDEQCCTIVVPYKWFTRNPFRSTYFACLAMAAETSTGALAMLHVYKRQPAVSMLVVKMEAVFVKKATGKCFFTCADGGLLKQAIDKAVSTGEGQTCVVRAKGVNELNEAVADFLVTWSFKQKSR